MRRQLILASFTIIILFSLLAIPAYSTIVGRFIMVTGEADLLKQGKIPGVRASVNDGVEPGDMIRTKARSKAQLRFVDDSILTLAPESRVTVADYLYDQPRGERRVVVRVFRGLVHTLVTRILNVQEPDFLMETHTAGLGVRGTEWYTLLMPSFTSVYLVQGLLDVRSNLPNLPAVLLLKSMEFTQIRMGQQPQLPKALSSPIIELLHKLMDTGIQDNVILGGGGIMPEGSAVPSKLPLSPEGLPQPSIAPTLSPQTPLPTGRQGS
jgi:hypothetical protein